jgi:hypothetical protein
MKEQVPEILEPFVRLLLEAVTDQSGERRNLRIGSGELSRFIMQDGVQRVAGGHALERRESREHLVKDNAKTEDVGAMVDAKAARDLRRHVRHRPHHCPAAVHRDGLGLEGRIRADQFRQAEVEDLYPAVSRDEEVARFDVAMNDAAIVRRSQTAGDLTRVIGRLAGRQRTAGHPVVQGVAIEHLGDQVRGAALDADVVDRQDVRVIESAGGSRFLLESAPTIRIIRKHGRENFDCDVAAELLVVCPVDLAHTTRSERADDLEAAKSIAHRKSHRNRPRL